MEGVESMRRQYGRGRSLRLGQRAERGTPMRMSLLGRLIRSDESRSGHHGRLSCWPVNDRSPRPRAALPVHATKSDYGHAPAVATSRARLPTAADAPPERARRVVLRFASERACRCSGPSRSKRTTGACLDGSRAGAWVDRRSGSAGALPLCSQSRSPAVAEIIGARRMWTVAMISSGSMPWR